MLQKLTYLIKAILVLPGTVVKQVLRRALFDKAGLAVYRVSYTRFANINSALEQCLLMHEPLGNLREATALTFFPFLVMSLLCCSLTLPAMTSMVFLSNFNLPVVEWFLLWVGLAIGVESVPDPDALDAVLELAEPKAEAEDGDSKGNNDFLKRMCTVFYRFAGSAPNGASFTYALVIAALVPAVGAYVFSF